MTDHTPPQARVPTALGPRSSPPRRPCAAECLLASLFLVILGSVPVVQAIVEHRRGDPIGALALLERPPTAPNLRAYERHLENQAVLGQWLRPGYQVLQFAGLHDGGEKALVGLDGWLFYKPGFDATVSRSPARPAADPVAAIVQFRDALAARGLHLLVVPAPNKETIYPDQLTRRARADQTLVSPTTARFLDRLQAAGVACVDLFALFAAARAERTSPPLYLAQDSHWSPAGVALAARAVAQRLQTLGWAHPAPPRFTTHPAPAHRLGDVVRMAQSSWIERAVAPEPVATVQVRNATDSQPYTDDPAAEFLVLGDSFLRIYQQDEPGAAGFVAHLAHALQQPLTSLVSEGGASTLVRQDLHRRPALLAHKRVVIWEFVERDLLIGAEGWQHVPLPPPVDPRPAP